jgi:hypothetical protein
MSSSCVCLLARLATVRRRLLQSELGAVRRSVTPWVVVALQQGLYADAPDTTSSTDDAARARTLAQQLEPLLVEQGVDLVLSGHGRRFHRSCPVIQGTCVAPAASSEALAPVHVTLGTGGAAIPLRGSEAAPAWMVEESFEHSVGQLTASMDSLTLTVSGGGCVCSAAAGTACPQPCAVRTRCPSGGVCPQVIASATGAELSTMTLTKATAAAPQQPLQALPQDAGADEAAAPGRAPAADAAGGTPAGPPPQQAAAGEAAPGAGAPDAADDGPLLGSARPTPLQEPDGGDVDGDAAPSAPPLDMSGLDTLLQEDLLAAVAAAAAPAQQARVAQMVGPGSWLGNTMAAIVQQGAVPTPVSARGVCCALSRATCCCCRQARTCLVCPDCLLRCIMLAEHDVDGHDAAAAADAGPHGLSTHASSSATKPNLGACCCARRRCQRASAHPAPRS